MRSTETPQILLPNKNPDELELTFAGNIVKHLGVQMYAGRPVPAIAELISNSWDADAAKVNVSLPLDQTWDPTNKEHIITVSDDGHGMNWEMIRLGYLDVGRDRRQANDTDKSPGGRAVQGRKGIGKLAGFGIADVMEIQTVHEDKDKSVNSLVLIWFRLSWNDLKKINRRAKVQVIYAGPVSKAPKDARKTKGTTVILKELHERKAQNTDRFHHSMAQRFLLLENFNVTINGKELRPELINLQWRWPELKKGAKKPTWIEDTVPGVGPVKYWIGFTPKPRQQNEGELSGILIYTRGKISQEATTFEISGGVSGQHGLRYLVGMVQAEWLDMGVTQTDHIATHRGQIAWESVQGQSFQSWGQEVLKKYLKEWAQKRSGLREEHIKDVRPDLKGRIGKLPPTYRKAAEQFVEKFKEVEMEPGEFEEILEWFLGALENATLRSILQKLKEAEKDDLEGLDNLLSKMEVRTAVTLLQIVESNLAAIDALEKMHLEDARERGVLSKHLEKNPWLIDPTWMLSQAEARVATWIKEHFKLEEKGQSGDDDRADFFCTAVGGTLHIVEIKRGAHIATSDDILQADKYRQYVEKRFLEITDNRAIRYHLIQSHLIAAELHQSAQGTNRAYADKGWVTFTTWSDLIQKAKIAHNQFKEVLEAKSTDDADLDEEEFEPSPPQKEKKTAKKATKKAARKVASKTSPKVKVKKAKQGKAKAKSKNRPSSRKAGKKVKRK